MGWSNLIKKLNKIFNFKDSKVYFPYIIKEAGKLFYLLSFKTTILLNTDTFFFLLSPYYVILVLKSYKIN